MVCYKLQYFYLKDKQCMYNILSTHIRKKKKLKKKGSDYSIFVSASALM